MSPGSEMSCTPPEIRESANMAIKNLLPEKSKKDTNWYIPNLWIGVSQISKKSLWSTYSMLKLVPLIVFRPIEPGDTRSWLSTEFVKHSFLDAATNKNLNQHLFKPSIQNQLNYNNMSDTGQEISEVQFVLFTRYNSPFQLRMHDRRNFNNSAYNTSNPTKVIIHGFLSSIKEDVFVVNKNAYLESGDFNVIGMDWSVMCEFEYLSAMNSVKKAGKILGQFLIFLSRMGVNLDDVHLIGHSLGAHVAGIASNELENAKIGRITGLDPAAPGFRERNVNLKLDSNDAKIVDVIHTYMKVLSLAQPIGHVDFYPNGGRWQPGCPDIYDIWKVSESMICNHARAYYLFAESIKNKEAFKSKQCDTLEDAVYGRCFKATNVYMGQMETYKSGLYYVRTKAKKPFSL